MTTPDDEIKKDKVTNEEYVPISELDEILDKDGNPLDAIEQNQSEESYEDDDGSGSELAQGIKGDQENKNDE